MTARRRGPANRFGVAGQQARRRTVRGGRGNASCLAAAALILLAPANPMPSSPANAAPALTAPPHFPQNTPPQTPPPQTPQTPTLQTTPVDPLVDAGWLLDHIGDADVVVLHVERRSGRFETERIAGARRLRFDEIAWEGEEGWIAEFRDPDAIVAALRRAGVGRDSRVVLYGASMTATARAWVTFDLLGLGGRAFVLDGGIAAWKAAGGAVEGGPAAAAEPGDLVPVDPADFRVSADWIHARLGDDSLVLLDARPDDEYTGEDGGLGNGGRPGHIPGAAQLYWEELMDPGDNTRFRPRDEIAAILARHGAGAGKTHVVYCMIGMRASVDYMAARMTGLEVYFYDGSWRDWGDRADLPVETGADPRDARGR